MCASSANSGHSLLQRPHSLSSLSLFSPSLPRCSFLPASNEPRRRRRPLRVEDDILQWPTISCIHSFLFFIRMPLLPSLISPNGSIYMPFSSHDDSLRHHRDASCQKEMRVSPLFPPIRQGRQTSPSSQISTNSQPQHGFNLFHAIVLNEALAPARVSLHVGIVLSSPPCDPIDHPVVGYPRIFL